MQITARKLNCRKQNYKEPLERCKTRFHLLAGPNGAGKTTLYRALASNGKTLEFVNADLHEQSHLQHVADLLERSVAVSDWAVNRREALLNTKTGFVSQTVFSHDSKLARITHARGMGFDVILYVVAVNDLQRLLGAWAAERTSAAN